MSIAGFRVWEIWSLVSEKNGEATTFVDQCWDQKLREVAAVESTSSTRWVIEAENGLGKNQDPGWENVVDPCVETGVQVMMSKVKKPCEDPDKYLFRNDILGPSVHQVMAIAVLHAFDGVLVNEKLYR
ncbi:hypothetical protein N7474_007308 [Penicillium riverlandense]|uniref:uncharacterized protein n=1 Tax=Penicillium riverlandense TaxID=1903569 RepID=UPI002548984F|nr:uncharacterized protein N7474_007308 [Penicillium riverlandense]KAJ5815531.1 hypothetical protein N7474_007308 [Penicillium riverlandense]